MSRQSENKENQGFQKKCPCCGNCKNLTSKMETKFSSWNGQSYTHETNLRCTIGKFAVGKSNWCQEHKFNE